ncbi:DMT family transporter [Kitasatospora sp. NPDC051853]|uniref:DMT family transporter n=1 Tax=Kitasatospora sp. NPDC051853 TaxID=3364058 RepID=UPI00379245F1
MRRSLAPFARDLPVLGVAVAWGSSFLVVKNVATEESVVAMLVLRFAVALPLLALFTWRGLRRFGPKEWLGGSSLGLVLGAVFLLETYGAVHTSATNAGLVISLTMVFTPLAESALARTRLPRAFVAAAGLSVLGVALLTGGGGGGFRAPGPGDLLVLGAALVRTAHVLTMARLRSIREADSGALTWVQLATATVVFAVIAPFTGTSPAALAASYGATDWVLLLHLSLACTIFAFVVQMWAVRTTSPSRVSLLLGTEPLWAAVFGITLAGDHLGPLGLLGALCVLAGTEWGRRTAAPVSAGSGTGEDVGAAQREPARERRRKSAVTTASSGPQSSSGA